jgi:AcrR family transcriptional regulator
MARVIKEEEHSARRNEILDAALKLLYAKGYAKMTIQDILDELRISKGAFYHYYDSKADVLDALVEHMVVEQVKPLLVAIVQDPHLTALEKLQRYFDTAVTWKTARKDLMLELLKVWYSDENALARQKMQTKMIKLITPLFMEIIDQGVREGVFAAPYPEYFGRVIINLIQPLGDTFTQMLAAEEVEHKPGVLRQAETAVAAYNDAMERVLGAPTGSIHLIDTKMLKEWFPADDDPALVSQLSTGQVGALRSHSP